MRTAARNSGCVTRYEAELDLFRRTYAPKTFLAGPTPVPYYDTGGNAPVLLVLHGAAQNAEYTFRRILQLREQCRVIAPTINGFRDFDALGRGLTGLLDALGAGSAHVLGGSFGGMVAQAFCRRHPSRIGNLILGFTAPPLAEYGRLFKFVYGLLRWMPERILKSLTKKEMLKMFVFDPAWPAETLELLEFYRMFFLRLLDSSIARSDLVGQYRLAVEFNAKGTFPTGGGFPNPRGRVLIATSRDDPSFKYHKRLKAAFPGAEEIVFEGGGHVGAIVHEEEYLRRVRAFLGGTG
jgi:pimeloyl-ACP methyl ester carboxylesterase